MPTRSRPRRPTTKPWSWSPCPDWNRRRPTPTATPWGSSERYALPLLHLAAFFTARFVYARDRNVRKNVFLDETHLMGVWGSGRALMVRLSRDSRKWNTAVGASSQHPDDHLSIGRIDALQGTAFVGRLTKDSRSPKRRATC